MTAMQWPDDTDPRLRSSRMHADVDRLRQQVALSWEREAAILERLGLGGAGRVLDLGSGPGFVAEALLHMLPESVVVAVDLDPEMAAAVSSRLAAAAGDRLLVLNNSALNIDLPDECMDFVLARYVFQHLAAPDLAASEVHRVLCAGGRLAVVDIDDAIGGIVDPPIPGLEVIGPKVAQLQAARGGNRYVGRKLWKLLREAGFENLAIDPILIHSDEVGIEPFLPQFDPERYRPFIGSGGISEQEWEAYRTDLERFLALPERFIAHLLLVVSGQKPAA